MSTKTPPGSDPCRAISDAPLAAPVDWLTGLRRIACGKKVAPAGLKRRPGCHLVAAGLALQALGLTPVEINLLPPVSHGVRAKLKRLGRAMSRKRPARTAWGIDLSTSGLKAVKLARDRRGRRCTIEDYDFVEHKKPLNQSTGDAAERELIDQTLLTFRTRKKPTADRICIGLSNETVIGLHLQLPPIELSKLDSLVEYEARAQLPIPLEDLVWGFHESGGSGAAGAEQSTETFVVAARRRQAQRHLENFIRNRIPVDLMQCDGLALYNLFHYEHFADPVDARPMPGAEHGHAVLLDIGSNSSNVVIGSPEGVWLRNFRLGGQAWTKVLVKELRLTVARAEKLKRNFDRVARRLEVYELLKPVFEDFLEETLQSIAMFRRDRRDSRIERVVGCGGGFQLHGLLPYLRTGKCVPLERPAAIKGE